MNLLSVHLQSNLIDLKEHASSLASSGLKKDSKLKSLEIAIEQKKEECSKLETQLQKVGVLDTVRNHSYELRTMCRFDFDSEKHTISHLEPACVFCM